MPLQIIGVTVFFALCISVIWIMKPDNIRFLGNILATVITTLTLILLVIIGKYVGAGSLRTADFEKNEIYETLGNAPLVNTFAVIVRSRDGKILAYELKTIPPPVFKASDNNTYKPYPDPIS